MQYLRPLRALAALALVALTLTGCVHVAADMKIDGKTDTVNGSLIVAVDKTVLLLSGKDMSETFNESAGKLGGLPKGSRKEAYDDGKFYGEKIFFEATPLTEFNGANRMPTIMHTDGRYRFAFDTAIPNGRLGLLDSVVDQYIGSVVVRFAVTFPGKVIQHNGDSIDGNTVTWSAKLTDRKVMTAVSEEEPAVFPWLLIFGSGAGLVILAILGAIVLIRRKTLPERALVLDGEVANQDAAAGPQ